MTEAAAYAIMNPYPKQYKFLFNVGYDEDTYDIAMAFIDGWLLDHDFTKKRDKLVILKKQGIFQIKVWLN